MARKRPAEGDFICMLCQCACDPWGDKHVSGGSHNFKSCGKKPRPILRSEWEAMLQADADCVIEIIRGRRL
jgi:hypothetical protein